MSDREIRRAVRAGAGCPREIADACGAGSVCGGCRPSVAAIIAESDPAPDERRMSAAVSASISLSPEAA